MIGKVIGDYKITSQLGEGGMGVVFMGEHATLGQQVAVKMLHPNLMSTDSVKQRFLREARAMARLRHQNILQLYNFIENDDGCFIIMEYVEGKTFEDMLEERGKLPVEESLNLFLPALDAMDYANQLGIIHRDIKPSNMMILNSGVVKVLDFGTAKIVGGEQLTRAGMTLGTIVYMSPEQLLGRELTPAADIYSLGATLYELLSGKLPFYDENDMQLMRMILKEQPTPIQQVAPNVPAPLAEVISKSLSKEAGQRFQSASEFKKAVLALNLTDAGESSDSSQSGKQKTAEPDSGPPPDVQTEEGKATSADQATETPSEPLSIEQEEKAPASGGAGLPPLVMAGGGIALLGVIGTIVLFVMEVGTGAAVGSLAGGLVVGGGLIAFGLSGGGGSTKQEKKLTKRPCTTCGRILLPTMEYCPFCNPSMLAAGEATMTSLGNEAGLKGPDSPPEVTAPPQQDVDLEAGEAVLSIVSGPNQGVVQELTDDGVTIGRATDNTVVLQDLGVSGHHARIDYYSGTYYLSDLQSSNGTFVNQERVSQTPLKHNDIILMGQTTIAVQIGA